MIMTTYGVASFQLPGKYPYFRQIMLSKSRPSYVKVCGIHAGCELPLPNSTDLYTASSSDFIKFPSPKGVVQ